MKILAMDTSNWPLGVALAEEDRLLGELNTQLAQNHSLRLMPAVQFLLEQVGVTTRELGAIAVAQGPGSYTGVRIGVTTAKTMAWSLQIPLIGVSSLQVVAQNRYDFNGLIIPMFDARRGQVYTGLYKREEELSYVNVVDADRIVLLEEWLTRLEQTDGPLLFIGEGVEQHRETIQRALGARAQFARQSDHLPRAGQLAYLGWQRRKYAEKNVHRFTPSYLQLAEAEAKWLKKQQESQGVSER